jgi:hypothetical protein
MEGALDTVRDIVESNPKRAKKYNLVCAGTR